MMSSPKQKHGCYSNTVPTSHKPAHKWNNVRPMPGQLWGSDHLFSTTVLLSSYCPSPWNAGWMLCQRWKRWPNIQPAFHRSPSLGGNVAAVVIPPTIMSWIHRITISKLTWSSNRGDNASRRLLSYFPWPYRAGTFYSEIMCIFYSLSVRELWKYKVRKFENRSLRGFGAAAVTSLHCQCLRHGLSHAESCLELLVTRRNSDKPGESGTKSSAVIFGVTLYTAVPRLWRYDPRRLYLNKMAAVTWPARAASPATWPPRSRIRPWLRPVGSEWMAQRVHAHCAVSINSILLGAAGLLVPYDKNTGYRF